MIESQEFMERVVELCLKSGSKGLPRKKRDRHIVLKSAAMTMDPHRGLDVEQVDAALKMWIGVVAQRLEIDHVTLRRELVDNGYLRRDPAGQFYGLYDAGPDKPEFSPDVGKLDVFDVALHGVCDLEQKRFDRFPRPESPEGKKLIIARMIARKLVLGEMAVDESCYLLKSAFESKCPFLSDLVEFDVYIYVLRDNESLARDAATKFLKKSDEWVLWLNP